MSMAEEFDAIADKVNASPELLSDEALINAMNKLVHEIIKADDYFAKPETLTPDDVLRQERIISKALGRIAME